MWGKEKMRVTIFLNASFQALLKPGILWERVKPCYVKRMVIASTKTVNPDQSDQLSLADLALNSLPLVHFGMVDFDIGRFSTLRLLTILTLVDFLH